MKLYLLTFDGQEYYVEATSMHMAQAVWLDAMRAEWESDWTGDEEPDQVALVHDEPVLRAAPGREGVPGEPEHGMGFGLMTEQLIEEGLIDPPTAADYRAASEE